MEYITIGIGIILILLGLSFAYKCLQAIFWGRITYWKGFLPITIISPLFIHLPGKNDRSLIRTGNYLWVHFIAGPIFFLLSLALLATGADLLGLPGSESINIALNLGRTNAPSSIIYSKGHGYRFPIIDRMSDSLKKSLITQPNEDSSSTQNQ